MTGALPILIGIMIAALAVIAIIYFMLQKKMQEGGKAYEIEKMLTSTKASGFSFEIFLQKAYNKVAKIPVLSRYLYKIRKRIEMLNNDDEYAVRKQSIKIFLISGSISLILAVVLFVINWPDPFMLTVSVLGITIIIETILEMLVDRLDFKMLKQTLDLFSEVRHYYHEYGMVDEAIYESAQILNNEMTVQGTAIYEMLIANDSETELEKYYDTAPNRYLKAFAGLSYLTREYGDRKVDGASLYLRNVNNISQELQMEILKRDKINYIFQSLSVISVAPLFVIKLLREWAVSTFSITSVFYMGKVGRVMEIIILLMGFLCYNLLRRIKETNDKPRDTGVNHNVWQAKVYQIRPIEWIVDRLMPVPGSVEYGKQQQLLIDTGANKKLEWVYVNRILSVILCFIAMMSLFTYLHKYEKNKIMTEPTSDQMTLGNVSEEEKEKQLAITDFDNYFIEKYTDKKYTREELMQGLITSTDLLNRYPTDEAAKAAAERIIGKVDHFKNEYVKPFEVLISIAVGFMGYFIPMWILKFQRKMLEVERESEVMQFQTLILMLMRIERISVETILEWLERFANIFKPSISTCLNNFEAGGWKALEQLKDESTYEPFIRLVENLQAAVEKIPIPDAFDELESERSFFQEKRKEANERLIAKKSMLGKVVGFAPMITLFVGYLIVPLIYVSITSMGEYMTQMQAYM